ncbi:MAG TPA: hypothetical protein VM599_10595 [Thermoanaerobaculia bacterium]|nr:hypothetical protein [Thermoanaerobaculia bacterium]
MGAPQFVEPILARHGISIRDRILDDEERGLWSHVGLAARPPGRRDLRRQRGPRSPKGQPFLTDRLATTLDRLDRLVDPPAP